MIEELRKEAENYEPKIGDKVWSFNTHNLEIIGPFWVQDIHHGICDVVDVVDVGKMHGMLHTMQITKTRESVAVIASDFYQNRINARKVDLGMLEAELKKFRSKENLL